MVEEIPFPLFQYPESSIRPLLLGPPIARRAKLYSWEPLLGGRIMTTFLPSTAPKAFWNCHFSGNSNDLLFPSSLVYRVLSIRFQHVESIFHQFQEKEG